MNTRHLAVLGLTAIGVTALIKGEVEIAMAVAAALGIQFGWDKIEKYTKVGKK